VGFNSLGGDKKYSSINPYQKIGVTLRRIRNGT